LLARAQDGEVALCGGRHRDVDGMLANHWYRHTRYSPRWRGRLGRAARRSRNERPTLERGTGKGSRPRHEGRGPVAAGPDRDAGQNGRGSITAPSGVEGQVQGEEMTRERSGTQFDPALVDLSRLRRRCCSKDLDLATGGAVIGAGPADPACWPEDSLAIWREDDRRLRSTSNPRTRPSRGVAELDGRRRRHCMDCGSAQPPSPPRRAHCTTSPARRLQRGVGTKTAETSAAELERYGLHPYLTPADACLVPLVWPSTARPREQHHHERPRRARAIPVAPGGVVPSDGRDQHERDGLPPKLDPHRTGDALTPGEREA